MMVFLLSLFGMPGLGGFLGKVYVMVGLKSLGAGGLVLIAALLLNTLVSLYFYMRPVYYMVFVADDKQRPTFPLATGQAVLFACAVALIWTGLGGGSKMADSFANLLSRKAPTQAVGPAATVGPAVPAIESPATTDSTQTAERPAAPALPL
jgi:formate hydrogenlyase subunit 3/multisubunit Na+/H+ antiporter MnhD subunit